MPRWETFHHVHIIGRVLRRMPACSSLTQAESAPGSPGWHVVDAYLQWLLPGLLQLTCCLRHVWSAEVILAACTVSWNSMPWLCILISQNVLVHSFW